MVGRQKTIFGYGGFFRLTPKNNKICCRIFYQANGFCSCFLGFGYPNVTVKFKYLFLDKRTGTFLIKAHYSLLIVGDSRPGCGGFFRLTPKNKRIMLCIIRFSDTAMFCFFGVCRPNVTVKFKYLFFCLEQVLLFSGTLFIAHYSLFIVGDSRPGGLWGAKQITSVRDPLLTPSSPA
jgi:hypothetical protein